MLEAHRDAAVLEGVVVDMEEVLEGVIRNQFGSTSMFLIYR